MPRGASRRGVGRDAGRALLALGGMCFVVGILYRRFGSAVRLECVPVSRDARQ